DDDVLEDNAGHTELRQRSNRRSPTPIDQFLTVAEIGARLMKLNDRKTPGEDGFSANIVKNFYVAAPEVLSELYNACMKYFCFPECFKRSLVRAVMKNNGIDPCLIKAWRP